MPAKTITAEIDGKVRTIKADIPDGASQEEIMQAVEQYIATQPPERTASGFAGNVISSGARMAGDIATAITNPLQTAKAVGQLGMGVIESVIPGKQGSEQNVTALLQMYVDRYGGWDNLTKTLYEDPVGVLADISMLAGGIGLAAKGAGMAAKSANLAKTAQAAQKVSKVAGAVSNVTDPVRIPGRVIGAVPGSGKIAERLYESALKPSLSEKNIPKVAGQVQTGLREGIVVSEAGAEKLAKLIDRLNSEISNRIQGSTAKIDPQAVASRVRDTADEFGKQVNPQSDLSKIQTVKQNYLEKHTPAAPPVNALQQRINATFGPQKPPPTPQPYPAAQAQAEKVGTYRQLRKKYGQLGSAEIEAEKALARGIKEELANAIPELKQLNARESKLLDLDKQLEHAVARIRNHQIFGIGTPIAAGGVGAMTGSAKAAAAAGIVRAVIDNPTIKSRLAIAINQVRGRKLSGASPRPTAATGISRVQEYIDALNNALSESGVSSAQ